MLIASFERLYTGEARLMKVKIPRKLKKYVRYKRKKLVISTNIPPDLLPLLQHFQYQLALKEQKRRELFEAFCWGEDPFDDH